MHLLSYKGMGEGLTEGGHVIVNYGDNAEEEAVHVYGSLSVDGFLSTSQMGEHSHVLPNPGALQVLERGPVAANDFLR